jgi:iron complex outermembrane recepter protein
MKTIPQNMMGVALVMCSVVSSAEESSAFAEGSLGKRVLLEEVVVTGSQIRGVEASTSPIIVLDRDYIDTTGVGTASGLMETLPQNFALGTQSGVSVPGSSGGRTQGSSINLRGIGEGTTLVLLNGRRMATGFFGRSVDISALPLSAIERVEILTDGASAIYGSDAVGGVVNFILRDDFQGAETRARAGWADGGMNEYRISQALGDAWTSGNALLSVEYYKRDILLSTERDFVPATSSIGSLMPQDKNYSVMFSGRQKIASRLSTFADVLYVKRDSYNRGGPISLAENNYTKNPQFTSTAGLIWDVMRDWQLSLSGGYADNEINQVQRKNTAFQVTNGPFLIDSSFAIKSAQVKMDGPLFELSGGSVRAAIGADWRAESYRQVNHYGTGILVQRGISDQKVQSAFGELSIPLIGMSNAVRGAERLLLSLAGRFDDYSEFGSSFDPRIGIMWQPTSGFQVRGSYGTSYVAPSLPEYNRSNNASDASYLPSGFDPASPNAPSHVVRIGGIAVEDLGPQESESWSVGVEFAPALVPALELSLNYYQIEYRDRIADAPNVLTILRNPSSFGSLIIRNPTIDQVNRAVAASSEGFGFQAYDPDDNPTADFDPSAVDVIVDTRRRNLSVVNTSGIDATAQYGFGAGGGLLQVGLNATYILDLEQQLTDSSDPYETVDTIYNPPRWRGRASIGWHREAWVTNLTFNHKDSYVDNRGTVRRSVASYSTVDARLAYDFSSAADRGFFAGVMMALTVQNAFDRDPPKTAIISTFSDMGFDPTNANPIGRLIALEFTKAW